MTPTEAWRQLKGFVDGAVSAGATDVESVQTYMAEIEKVIEWPPAYGTPPVLRTGRDDL